MTFFKSIIIAVSILFVLLWANLSNEGLFAISEKKGYKTGENHALIIGINSYNHWPELKSPVKDAEEIAKILTDKYNFKKRNVVLLTDKTKEKPTLTNILTSLENYLGKLTEKDNLLVFFSGHSTEDDAGETYWIPKDGKKKTKMTWLGHSDLSSEYFASEKFNVKHLCIITDSLFTKKLIKSKSISLTPYDLRYVEKIIEKATQGSREVISFGDQHWPGSKNTDGLGLFTYYIRKALLDNQLEIIDFENLIFEENIMFPITKIAGTKMLRGRLNTPMEKGGQYIITKIIPSPLINVIGLDVSPEKGYPGDSFILQAKTNASASEVYVEIAGQKHLMEGDGIDWKYSLKIDRLGSTNFNVTAINRNDLEGQPKPGQITTVKRRAKTTNVQQVAVNPKKGFGGDKYRFTATTDAPASKVALIIKGKAVQMEGSGVDWFLSKTIEDIGTVNFSAIATNEDGIQGLAGEGTVQIEAGPVNVAEVIVTPTTGYAGEEFMVTANTDRFASSVSLQIDGNLYPMEGSGKTWEYKKKIPDIGKKQFTVIAKNIKGDTGISKSGVILTKKSPLPIPDVIAADVSIISPGKGYPGDRFIIKAKTSSLSNLVYVEIEGKKDAMKGSGTEWNYTTQIDKAGASSFVVSARNKDGIQGQSKEGKIITAHKPVNVIMATVSPKKGEKGQKYIFKAKTDTPARSVTLSIGENRYEMTGSNTEWLLSKKINETGELDFSISAKNEDNVTGGFKKDAVTVLAERFQHNADGTITDIMTGETKNRFVDNKDGTITDLLTNQMWLKQPKQIALSWENAVEYCRNLEYKGYTGWRLPTISEFKELRDNKYQNPALPPENPFSNVVTHVTYWSKTKHKFGPQYVYDISMWNGKIGYQKKNDNAIVWPTRYAELPK